MGRDNLFDDFEDSLEDDDYTDGLDDEDLSDDEDLGDDEELGIDYHEIIPNDESESREEDELPLPEEPQPGNETPWGGSNEPNKVVQNALLPGIVTPKQKRVRTPRIKTPRVKRVKVPKAQRVKKIKTLIKKIKSKGHKIVKLPKKIKKKHKVKAIVVHHKKRGKKTILV